MVCPGSKFLGNPILDSFEANWGILELDLLLPAFWAQSFFFVAYIGFFHMMMMSSTVFFLGFSLQHGAM